MTSSAPAAKLSPNLMPSRFLLQLGWGARFSFCLAAACGLAGGILAVRQARLLAGVITSVFTSGEGLASLQPALVWLLAVILLRSGLVYLVEYSARTCARKIKTSLRFELLTRLSNPLRLRQQDSGELAVVINNGIEALDAYFSQYLPQAALAALVPAVILISVFPLDGLSGWILLLTAPLIPFFMLLIGKAGERKTRRQWAALSRLGSHFLDTLQGLATLKALNRSQTQGRALAASGERYRLASMEVLRLTFLSALALEWLATISTALLAVQVGLRLLSGGISLEQALTVLILAPEFYQPLRSLGLRFHAAQSGLSSAARIMQLLEENPARPAEAKPQVAPAVLQGGLLPPLHFHHVTCVYTGSAEEALQDVSFTLEPGIHTVLVGPSGAGKTTILQLLLGFIQPDSGRIWAGEVPLDEIDPAAWRSLCAWVPEKPHLFHDSIAANIRLGSLAAQEDEVKTAAALAGLDGWIHSLPSGYATIIGEGGSRLSSGQAQRVALARAFLKDAPFLLLDEPTSSLDPELADELMEVVEKLGRGRTVLTIAHRLSTTRRAGRILALEGGRIVEDGSPQKLSARGGLYARLQQAAESGQG